jgi:hypothetical protein
MRLIHRNACLGSFLALGLVSGPAGAQTSANTDKGLAATAGTGDSVAPAPDSAAPKKKGGLFGKVKSVAGNKVVRQVAKTAACTMVPGGQVIAGAIEAASSKDAGEAAVGAAGAANGTTCMPGGIGGTGLGGSGVLGAATQAAAAKAAVDQSGSAAGYGSMLGIPGDGAGFGSMEEMPSAEETAQCLGINAEEYLALTNPTGGQPRQPTKDEMKLQAKLAKKVDMRRYQACMMQSARTATAPPSP